MFIWTYSSVFSIIYLQMMSTQKKYIIKYIYFIYTVLYRCTLKYIYYCILLYILYCTLLYTHYILYYIIVYTHYTLCTLYSVLDSTSKLLLTNINRLLNIVYQLILYSLYLYMLLFVYMCENMRMCEYRCAYMYIHK